jgi:hypothetical protein
MKIICLAMAGVFALIAPSFAQQLTQDDLARINLAKDLVKETCLSGSSTDFDAKVNGEITLKGFMPGGTGEIKTNVKSTPGAVGYMNEQIRSQVEGPMRDCLMKLMPQVIDAVLGKKSSLDNTAEKLFALLDSPPINVSANEIKTKKPSGTWNVNEIGERYFAFSSSAFNMPVFFYYFTGKTDQTKFEKITIRHESSFTSHQYCSPNCSPPTWNGNLANVKQYCGPGFAALISDATGAFGRTLEAPVHEVKDISSDMRTFARCLTDPVNFECSNSGRSDTENYKF